MGHSILERRIRRIDRNDRLVDPWSFIHLATGIALGWLMHPFWALAIMVLWEPLEINILSRLSMKYLGREFGFESWRNAMSDVLFDLLGVAIGAFAVRQVVAPPFVLLS